MKPELKFLEKSENKGKLSLESQRLPESYTVKQSQFEEVEG